MPINQLRTVNVACALIAALFVFQLATLYGQPNGWLRDETGRPAAKDFVNFYSAGMLAAEGRPAAAYDWDAHKAAQRAVIGEHNTAFFPWPYPPMFLAAAEALTVFPYTVSYVLFGVLTFAAAAYVAVRITGERSAVLWLAAFSGTLWNIYAGQNALLTTALFGAGLLALPARPVAAGIAFGLMAYKPQLGLVIPLALAAGGYWRAFLWAGVTVAATALLSAAMYGLAPWWAFIDQLGRVGNAGLVEAYSNAYKFQSAFGFARAAGADPAIAMTLHLIIAAASAAAVAALWRSNAPADLKCAGLAAGIVTASPYIFIYDMAVLAIGAAFLIRHLMAHSTTDERMQETVLALFGVNVLVYMFPFLSFPSGPIAALLLALLIWRELPAKQAAPTAAHI